MIELRTYTYTTQIFGMALRLRSIFPLDCDEHPEWRAPDLTTACIEIHRESLRPLIFGQLPLLATADWLNRELIAGSSCGFASECSSPRESRTSLGIPYAALRHRTPQDPQIGGFHRGCHPKTLDDDHRPPSYVFPCSNRSFLVEFHVLAIL